MRPVVILLSALFLLLGGCSSKPTRHLAADAALIKPGHSSVEDVVRYLGEPNGRRVLSAGEEQFVYSQDRVSTLARVPYLGSWIGDLESDLLVITIKNGLVTKCEFHQFSASDRDWADDFTWDKVQ